jgi:hypothetical protein
MISGMYSGLSNCQAFTRATILNRKQSSNVLPGAIRRGSISHLGLTGLSTASGVAYLDRSSMIVAFTEAAYRPAVLVLFNSNFLELPMPLNDEIPAFEVIHVGSECTAYAGATSVPIGPNRESNSQPPLDRGLDQRTMPISNVERL